MQLADESVAELMQQVVADGKAVAQSEIALLKARMSWRVAAAKTGAIAGVAALALFHLLLIGLVVGVLLILTQAVGAIWATVIVLGVLLVLATLFGYVAYAHFSRAFGSEDDLA